MEVIINYFVAAFKALLALFGVQVNPETEDNLENMFGNITGFVPESKPEAK